MKSRVSFCNGALLRRSLSRTALIWVAYLLLWLIMLPGTLLSAGSHMDAMALRQLVLQRTTLAHGMSFFYGVMVAWFLFAYLCRGRSANFFAALPLRRETVFMTHYLSGLLCSLVPNFLIMGLTILSGFAKDANVITEAGTWFAAHSMTYLFYYSFAVLCAMLVGQIVAMPLLYGMLNLSAVVLESLLQKLSGALIYGVQSGSHYLFSWLSPLYYFIFEDHGPRYESFWDGAKLKALRFSGWNGLLIITAVGLVFAAAAFWCYRRRRMEAAGDVMAVRHLRPVFRWCFTFGCTVVIGVLLATLLVDTISSSYFCSIAICLLIATVVGYFLSEMILSKSLRVFHKKNLLCSGISCLVILALLACCRLDVFGIARYVPDANEVQGVILFGRKQVIQDPSLIRQTLNLHKQILNRQQLTEEQIRDADWSPLVSISYVMQDGNTVTRSYYLPITAQTATDTHSLIRQYEDLINQPTVILARETPASTFSAKDIDYFRILYWADESTGLQNSLDLSSYQAMNLWKQAMYKDLAAGNMGKLIYTDSYTGSLGYTGVSIEFSLRESALSERESNYYYYAIPVTAVNTIQALRELGVPATAFQPVS